MDAEPFERPVAGGLGLVSEAEGQKVGDELVVASAPPGAYFDPAAGGFPEFPEDAPPEKSMP